MSTPLRANEARPRPALLARCAVGMAVQSMAEKMPRAADAEVLRRDAAEGRWALTLERDYSDLVVARAVPFPPAIVYLRQGAYASEWPARNVLVLLPRADWVAGYLVGVSRRALRRRPLPAA